MLALAFRAGMERISGAIQSRNGHAMVGNRREEITARAIAFEDLIELNVRSRRPIPTSEFETFYFQTRRSRKHCVEWEIRQTVRQQANLHRNLPL